MFTRVTRDQWSDFNRHGHGVELMLRGRFNAPFNVPSKLSSVGGVRGFFLVALRPPNTSYKHSSRRMIVTPCKAQVTALSGRSAFYGLELVSIPRFYVFHR